MRLLSIELSGFKSFADKTKVNFQDGINAIVGPNGCGKSNIVDAFTWVLGEQSAKSLRADKMTDVIFAGTKSRKSVNFAEVTLVFSNEANRLPIPAKEVAITRRLYRTGESEYLINKKAVRLKDLHELFLHTGLGKEAFAVIGQGRVEEEIAQSPFERRKIFDELAGISRSLLKRKETLERLKKSSENVEKAKIRFDEIFKQLEELKRQADEARSFEGKKAQLEQMKKSLSIKKKIRFQNKHIELKAKIAALDASKEEKGVLESTLFRELAALKELVEIGWKKYSAHSQEHERLSGQKNLVQQMLSQAEDKVKKTNFRQTQLSQELIKADKLHGDLEAEKINSEKRHQALENKLKTDKGVWEKASFELKAFEESITAHFTQLKSAQHALVQVERETNSKQVNFQSIEKAISDNKRRLEAVVLELNAKEPDSTGFEELGKEKAVLSESIEKDRGQLPEINKQVHAFEDSLKIFRTEKMQAQTARYSAQTKLTTLEALRRDHVGVDVGVKKLLEQAKNKKSPLYAAVWLLADILDRKSLKSVAIESFSAVFSTFLVVQDKKTLSLLLETADSLKVSHFSCFCLELMGMSLDEWKTWVTSVPVVEGVEDVLEWAVLPGGKLVSHGVIQSYGVQPKNPLMLDQEIEKLVTEVQKATVVEDSVVAKEQELLAKLEVLQGTRRALDLKLRQNEIRLVEVNKTLYELERKQLQRNERKNSLERDKKAIEDSIISSEKLLKPLISELSTLKESLQSAQNTLNRQEAHCKDAEKTKKDHFDQVQSLEKAYRMVEKETRDVERIVIESSSRLVRVREEKERLQAELKYLVSTVATNEEKRQELIRQVIEKQTLLDESLKSLGVMQVEVELKKQQVQEKEALLQKLRLEGETVRGTHLQASKELVAVESELEKVRDVEVEAVDGFIDFSEGKLQTEINKFELACKDAGSINFRAIQDYETMKSRQDFSGDELQDLELSQKALLEMVQQIEEDASSLFKKTFSDVREAFQVNFSKLFGGGDADLILVEAENQDPLSCGIEIIAKPPGKDMRTLQLLSGGEKTMTAFALLMAFFQVRPSPCCILDEVDAPLDEANVLRFTELLRAFSDRCQFLLITHNKKTMVTCDHLVGVSMEQKGISTVLQLQLVS